MPLDLIVDSIDGLGDSVKGLYKEVDGKFHLDVTGLPDVTGLKSALDKERIGHRAASKLAKDLQTKWVGVDRDVVRVMLDQADTDAESKLIAEGKVSEVIEARLAKHQQATQTQLDEKDTTINGLTKKALENIFRTVAGTEGVHTSAIDDILLRGSSVFQLDANGNAVQLGDDGHPILGADGKSSFSPAEWLKGMRESSPHWFPANDSGGGSEGGGKQNSSFIKDPIQRINNARGVSDK